MGTTVDTDWINGTRPDGVGRDGAGREEGRCPARPSFVRPRDARHRSSAGSVSQKVLEALVDERGVRRVGAAACKMAPYARDDAQFRVRHAFDLPGVVFG